MDYKPIDMVAIRNRLYSLMKSKYKSKSDFYNKTNISKYGVSEETIKKHFVIGKNGNGISLELLYIYAQVLDVSADYILFGDKFATDFEKETVDKYDVCKAIITLKKAFKNDAINDNTNYNNVYIAKFIISVNALFNAKDSISENTFKNALNESIDEVPDDFMTNNPQGKTKFALGLEKLNKDASNLANATLDYAALFLNGKRGVDNGK